MNHHESSPRPDRWSGAPASVLDAIAAARADLPSKERIERLAAALPTAIPTGPGPSSAPQGSGGASGASGASGAGAAGSMPSTLSGALIGAALGVVVSGASLLWSPSAEPQREPRAVSAASAPAATTPASPVTAPRPEAAAVVQPVAPAARSAVRPSPAPALTSSMPSGLKDGAPVDAPAAITASSDGTPSVKTPESDTEADTESEAHLLERAQDALASSPAAALALAERHASRFAHGLLGQEREVVAIQALVRLGRASEAKARAQRFTAAHPGSAHRPRIEALVGL